ncbi:hypothetical protein [Gimesia algae]|uniref:Response regulatory domain-containing protein n=1 Tax=Gimesia algae TaxID=2527971 RepID=A0A517V8T0_9PLAN|nr:hypothetical protein [Gimesia algae]QDT89398.1 hypothetical protein Pan161_10270 [Gimesia algae]
MPNPASQVLVLCSDIMFSSQITGAARQLEYSFCTVLSTRQAAAQVDDSLRQVLLVDLNQPSLNWDQLKTIHQEHPALISIAFGPHVDVEKLAAARAAGCTEVMPRSRFSAQLSQILESALTEEA